jgi:chromosome segregation ATPase
MSKTEKGLVYKLSQKCLEQEEEIQNLLHNFARMQEVIEKQQTELNKKQAQINMLKAQLKNSKEDFDGLDQETIESFDDIFSVLNNIMDKVQNDKDIQKDMLNYLADQGELIKIFKPKPKPIRRKQNDNSKRKV